MKGSKFDKCCCDAGEHSSPLQKAAKSSKYCHDFGANDACLQKAINLINIAVISA